MTILRKFTSYILLASSLVAGAPVHKRQEAAPALSDLDILQFALTLEHLEAAFYKEGFEKFPASDFQALGLSQSTIDSLVAIGETEATHVEVLKQLISGEGATPVEPCTYDFKLTDAASMVQTARVLEAVGISAYLGAAPLVQRADILGAAASVVTVESRHQTAIRSALGAKPVPQAFDAAIGPLQIFTLASQFITECPAASDLGLTALAPLNVLDAGEVRSGSTLRMDAGADAGTGLSCSFTTGDGGLVLAPFEDGACVVPEGLGGEVFVTVTSQSDSADITTLADDSIVAGPAVLVLS